VRAVRISTSVVTMTAALLGFTAVAAWAHTRLVRSDPPKNARLVWPPTVIRLTRRPGHCITVLPGARSSSQPDVHGVAQGRHTRT